MYLTLLGSVAAALAIGQYFGDLAFALTCGAVLLTVGSVAFFAARGRWAARLALTLCNVAAVILHIQLGFGTVEFHFGIFVLLGLLLVYRDWRILVVAAGLFALHHIAFDRLQALHFAVYCTAQANFPKMLLHAAYVVVQTGVEIVLAVRLREAAIEASELSAIVHHVDRGDQLCLDVTPLAASAPSAVILKEAIARMAAAMADVSGVAASIGTAASEIATGNLDLSRRTEQQAASLQQTAASMEQLTGTVKNTAGTAGQATGLAGAAALAAGDGNEAVARITATMTEISQSARRIADITGLIDSIAFQTNLLALNAAVEAARAGEHGRGFAVVASEVRQLAQRSATAASEIKTLTGDSVEKVSTGMSLVNAAGNTMDSIVSQVRNVSALISEISGASTQQTVGIGQVSDAVTQLDAVTQQNAAQVEQSAAAAESLHQQAIRLSSVVDRFVLGKQPVVSVA
ncbi:methyl-accepting chemotaxis protein [Paraburkholderia caffeinilytica]|uniref:methyl-accepting chemotaxis protein n=1 Tax=Paraburkholderia caffeinilytica TaxID=1761016 RepID=UPI0038BBB29D